MGRLVEFASEAIRGMVTGRVHLKTDCLPLRFEQTPRRKVLNAILAESSVLFRPSRPWAWPNHLFVEPSSRCNLRCTLCPVTSGLGREQGHLEVGLFKKVLDEVGPYVFTLLFWGWGEPFLNPRSCEMIAYARAKGVKVVSSTNGHPFADEEHADRLVRSGIDAIIFAIDGVTQESYERYRQGGKLETALQGIRNVAARKKVLGSTTPLINFRFIVMAQNEDEIPAVRELAPAVGAEALTFKTLNPFSIDPYAPSVDDPGGGTSFLPANAAYHRFRTGRRGEQRIRRRTNPCKHLWTHPVIHWDGTVVSCSYDPCNQFPLGNVRDKSFREVWRGDAYRAMRKQFRGHWQTMPRCSDCSYAYEGGSCSHETIAEAFFYRDGIQV